MIFGTVDFLALMLYFAASLFVGLWFGRGGRTTADFLLGGRRQHWLLVGMSILATEVSALTVILVPATSFRDDWAYLQLYFGAFIGRLLIVYLLLPAFYGGSVTTVYEYLGQRFGPRTRVTASLMFLVSRFLGSGFRLLAASLAVAVIFDWPLTWVVLATAGIAVLYTTIGGIKAILWTDALQACVFLFGPIALIVFVFMHTAGDWVDTVSAAYEAGKMHIFTWGWSPNNERSFWVLAAHAIFMNMAALGTDQDLTQRMLTCPDVRRGQRALLFNAILGFPVVCLFLFVGTAVCMYYDSGSAAALPDAVLQKDDRILPHFIATALPVNYGIKGLLIAAIFAASMSSLSSAIGAISSTVVTDLYRPLRPARPDRHYLALARMCTLFSGVALAGVALAFSGYNELLWEAFKVVSVVFGGMLGVFLLGVTTANRGRDGVTTVAMLLSVAGLVTLKYVQERMETVYVAWPWWVVIGTAFTFLVGLCTRTRSTDFSDSVQSLLTSGTD